MAQRYPYQRSQERREFDRSERHPSGSDHDRYRTGGERRYSSDRDERYGRDRGYEGDRSYRGSGYAEETGYRREERDERNEHGAQQRGYPYQGSGPAGWEDSSDEGGGYYGTGHFNGGFGTAAGSRAISRNPYAPGGDIDFYGSSRRPSFRGRGPKGYQRTDERLKELICETLMEDPDIDASEVSIEVSGGVVTLTGTVEDRRTKYQIEEATEYVSGVKDINNQLRVQSGWLSRSGSQGQSSEATSARSGTDSASLGASGAQSSGTQSTSSTFKRS